MSFAAFVARRKKWTRNVPEMQVEELKQKLDAGEDLYVLDVREPHEYQICKHRRTLDSAGRFAEAGERVWIRAATLWRIAARGCVAPRR